MKQGTHGRRRLGFAASCASLLALSVWICIPATTAGADSACSNEAARVAQHATYLPDCRAYELVSPEGKAGGEVITDTTRTRAASDGQAIAFASLVGFGDLQGTGVATEYMAERSSTAEPGDNGWATHAITPAQGPIPTRALGASYEPEYPILSRDLTSGVFTAISPLTSDPFVEDVANVYSRSDLATPGPGAYMLASGCPLCEESDTPLPPYGFAPGSGLPPFPRVDGASADSSHVLFESFARLTKDSNADPHSDSLVNNVYESDHGVTRLVSVVPESGNECADPNCLAPSRGATAGRGGLRTLAGENNNYTPHVISADGSRAIFTVASGCSGLGLVTSCGQLYLRELTADPPRSIKLNALERSTPSAAGGAAYWDASADDSRVFFTSNVSLTDDSGAGLYMWSLTPGSEVQELEIEATGGSFTLSYEGETTPALPCNAGSGEIEAALNALAAIGSGGGSVAISGSGPFTVTFQGTLAHTDIPEIAIDGSGLTGAGTVSSTETNHGGHLTHIGDATLVLGASEDGHYVYFASAQQLVEDEPPVDASHPGIFLWHDGSGTSEGGELRFIGQIRGLFSKAIDEQEDATALAQSKRQARVSSDGRSLLFVSTSGSGLLSLYGGSDIDQSHCGELGCREFYLYQAETNRLQCVSCRPDGVPPTQSAAVYVRKNYGASLFTAYENRAISDDGRYVFFSTPEPLVAADSNGISDAYEFDSVTGEAHLLSSGQDSNPSYFMDTSADGRDAFIATRERLVGWDVDKAYDLYDVRVGGGFPEPLMPPSVCEGDACQPPPVALNDPTPGSASLRGPGNPKTHKRAARHKHKRHRSKRRHAQRRNHRRTTSTSRGGSR
ncbi:MAG TPA: hypothetical protein VFN89_06890 [Solirubrobacterales bacterium]|nr:hypothetical protein [Solirubrobacterales bacterium]